MRVGRSGSITRRRAAEEWERGGVRFTVSSAARCLTNYLWNCCIHSHLNRNLSGEDGLLLAASSRPGGESHPSPWPLRRRRALLVPCSISLSDHPPFTPRNPASHPIASRQASPFSPPWWIEPNANLQPFHMSMPPPDRLQEHSSTSRFQDVLPDASGIIGLLSISRLHTSQLNGD